MKESSFDRKTKDFYLREYKRMIRIDRPNAIMYSQSAKHLILATTNRPDSIGLKIKSDQYGNMTFFAEAVVNGSNEIIPDDPNEMHITSLNSDHVIKILPAFIKSHWPQLADIPVTVYKSERDMKSGINPGFRLNPADQIIPTKPAKAS